jgi:hypothetical protein
MRAHIIENSKVVNTIEVDSLDFMEGLIDAENGGAIGDTWDGMQFIAPAVPKPTASEINAPIIAALDVIDMKSIRALRDGDQTFLDKYRAESAALRKQLVK